MRYKTVKLEESVYNALVKMGGYGETMSEIVGRLLKIAGDTTTPKKSRQIAEVII